VIHPYPIRSALRAARFAAIACGLFLAPLSASAMDPDELMWETAQAHGLKIDFMANHRTVAQPTLFITKQGTILHKLPFSPGCYSGLQVVTYKGAPHVMIVESPACGGNAVPEVYHLVNLKTFLHRELSYPQLKRAGIPL
jgi:hypothetical protein